MSAIVLLMFCFICISNGFSWETQEVFDQTLDRLIGSRFGNVGMKLITGMVVTDHDSQREPDVEHMVENFMKKKEMPTIKFEVNDPSAEIEKLIAKQLTYGITIWILNEPDPLQNMTRLKNQLWELDLMTSTAKKNFIVIIDAKGSWWQTYHKLAEGFEVPSKLNNHIYIMLLPG